ncbi:MAG: hypothetical protein J5726_04590 [Treponema sp.]|nr:hypothetical protein [Treponema sp.]
MNIYTWIFAGLLGVNLILYIVGMAQRLGALEKVARVLFVPFVVGIIHSILAVHLPDSYHILFISSFAFLAAAAFMLLTLGDKNKFIKLLEESFHALTQIIWLLLIVSVYRIYRVPQWIFIISGAVYFAGFVVICIFIKKQSFARYFSAILMYAFSTAFGITTLISLIYEKRLFGVMMFIGSLVYMFGTVLIIFQRNRPFAISEKVEKLLVTITTVCATALMGTGAILMQI